MIIIYFLRLLFLDADAHSYILNEIQPVDEVYYNEIALKIADIGLFNVLGKGVGFVTLPNAKCYLVSNIITGISLSVFGKTYFALRLPNVILGLIGLLFMAKILDICKVERKIKYICVIFFVVDFNLLTLTRSAVTIIPCMVTALLYVYVYLHNKSNYYLKFFWGGAFISIFSFCSVYMGVSFFILGNFMLAFILLYQNREYKDKMKQIILGYVSGNLAGLVLSETLAIVFLREHVINVVLSTFSGFGEKISESLAISTRVIHWAKIGTQFWTAYMFRYNYMLLLLFVISIFCWWKKEKAEEFFLFTTFLMAHWIQTIVLENATASKATISYGIIIIFVAYTWHHFEGLNISKVLFGSALMLATMGWMLGYIKYNNFFHKTWIAFWCV